jgi:hypothetical protein
MKCAPLIAFAALSICGISRVEADVAVPKGWTDKSVGDARVVSNGNATVVIQPWQSLGGQTAEDWLRGLEQRDPEGGRLLSSEGVKPEAVQGAYSVMRHADFDGEKGYAILYACPGHPDEARLMTLDVRDGGFFDTLAGATFGETVCKESIAALPVGKKPTAAVSQHASSQDEGTTGGTADTGGNSPADPTQTPPDALPPIGNLDGLKEIRGLIIYGIQPGGMFGTTEDFIALFEDGSYSSDLARLFGVSKEASKSERPNRWGQWRISGDELELKDNDEDAFDTTSGNWVAVAGETDQRLAGCYGNINSTSGADYTSGTTVGVARSWCFYPNGRFTNKASAYGSSSNPGAAMGVSSKARGRYRIDGNVARMVYDDGHEVIAAFGFINKDRTHIMLNGKRFMGSN